MGLGDETRLIAFTGLIFINFKTLSLMLGPLRMSFNTVLYRDACFCEALCFLAMCFLLSTSKHVVNYLPRPMQDFFFSFSSSSVCVFLPSSATVWCVFALLHLPLYVLPARPPAVSCSPPESKSRGGQTGGCAGG